MSKCFQAIGKLKLDTEEPVPGRRPKALGMVSCVGEENVPFKAALPLEGKVRGRSMRVVLCDGCAACQPPLHSCAHALRVNHHVHRWRGT